VGGIEVSIGKLAIYTAAGGIDPARAIPVTLDVGTNSETLPKDPMYIGNPHARIRGERYDDFIEADVQAVSTLFPHALLQWEDFAPGNGRRILEKYRDRICTFNDDMQGTGAITLAAALSAVRQPGASLLPHADDLRSVSVTVAVALAVAVAAGVAGVKGGDMVERVEDAMWRPEYRRIEAG